MTPLVYECGHPACPGTLHTGHRADACPAHAATRAALAAITERCDDACLGYGVFNDTEIQRCDACNADVTDAQCAALPEAQAMLTAYRARQVALYAPAAPRRVCVALDLRTEVAADVLLEIAHEVARLLEARAAHVRPTHLIATTITLPDEVTP